MTSEELQREGKAGLVQDSESIFGSFSGFEGKVANDGASPLCPACSSEKVWRDGLRYPTFGDPIQRWLCRVCGFRFSDPEGVKKASEAFRQAQSIETQSLKSADDIVVNSQICVSETKNLVALEKPLTSAGTPQRKKKFAARTNVSDEVRAIVKVFRSWLIKEGYGKESRYPNNLQRLAALGADLSDPESVKDVIGKIKVRNGTKLQYIYAYDAFATMTKISWEPPKYRQENIIPFVPEEEDLDCLIAACRSRQMATYLQCLKETFGDPGEVLRIEREDVSGNIVTINHPVKNHLPRQIEVSDKLIAMMNSLPNKGKRFFAYSSYDTCWSCYDKVRKRAAEVQKNPVLLQIELRSFRHWAGTMLAIMTNGNVTIVQSLLGHRQVTNTMKYIDIAKVRSRGVNDECDVSTASTPEEMKQLLGAGFQLVTEKFGLMWFTRPKRFRGLKCLGDKAKNTIIKLK